MAKIEGALTLILENEKEAKKVYEYLLQAYTGEGIDLHDKDLCSYSKVVRGESYRLSINNLDFNRFTLTKNDGSINYNFAGSDYNDPEPFLHDLEKGSGVESIACKFSIGTPSNGDDEYSGRLINFKNKYEFDSPNDYGDGSFFGKMFDEEDYPFVWYLYDDSDHGDYGKSCEYEPPVRFLVFKNKKTGERFRGPWVYRYEIGDIVASYENERYENECDENECDEDEYDEDECDEGVYYRLMGNYSVSFGIGYNLDSYDLKIACLVAYCQHDEVKALADSLGESLWDTYESDEFLEIVNNPERWKFNPDDWEFEIEIL